MFAAPPPVAAALPPVAQQEGDGWLVTRVTDFQQMGPKLQTA